uniref:Tripartite motif containing 39 n=1 Tax=Gopherus agassizii TaxID=38772 RepID=A0A452HVU7_9SAUR
SHSGLPVESLQEEATCPICLEYFTEPVTLECGHNFCRACISQCWEGSDTAASCPQCRETVQQRNLRPNRQLANVLEIAKRLSLQKAKGTGGDGVCGEHQEALKLFCEEDQTPICVVCDRSRAHRAHTVVPIQEAAQEYKVGNCYSEERERKKQIQTERQKIVSEFQQLREFLEEQERLLLAQLEKLDEEIVRIQNENVSKLSEEISRLSELISEMEGKCQKPASEFLQVRLNEKRRWVLLCAPNGCSANQLLLLPLAPSVNVTLDPDTAHPKLVLSEDRKSVTRGDTRQQLSNTPERFDTAPCVLGCEGFTSGRHCWEVEVRGGRFWSVGVRAANLQGEQMYNSSIFVIAAFLHKPSLSDACMQVPTFVSVSGCLRPPLPQPQLHSTPESPLQFHPSLPLLDPSPNPCPSPASSPSHRQVPKSGLQRGIYVCLATHIREPST